MRFAGFEPGRPPRSWLTAALVGARPQEVLPRAFPACLRVLHPARSPNQRGTDVALSWSHVEDVLGVPNIHVGAVPSLASALAEAPRAQVEPPQIGTLPPEQAWRLVDALEPELTDPRDCWFGVWEGFGCLRDLRERAADRLALRGGDYLTLHAPLYFAARPLCERQQQGVNLWWGPDAPWCVHTDVELDSTLVAGSRALVQRVLEEPALETLVVAGGGQRQD